MCEWLQIQTTTQVTHDKNMVFWNFIKGIRTLENVRAHEVLQNYLKSELLPQKEIQP